MDGRAGSASGGPTRKRAGRDGEDAGGGGREGGDAGGGDREGGDAGGGDGEGGDAGGGDGDGSQSASPPPPSGPPGQEQGQEVGQGHEVGPVAKRARWEEGRGERGPGGVKGRKARVRESARALGTGPMAGWLGRRVCVVTCDGRTLVGMLVGCDAGINLVLKGCEERLYSESEGVKVVDLGLYVLRGNTVAVVGEVDAGAEAAVDFKAQRAPPIPTISHNVHSRGPPP